MSSDEKRYMVLVAKITNRLEALVDYLGDALKKVSAELREIEVTIERTGGVTVGTDTSFGGAFDDARQGIGEGLSSSGAGTRSAGSQEVIQVKSIAAADRSLEEMGDKVLKRQVEVLEGPSAKPSSGAEEETQIVKLTLAGYGAVGKTTIFKLLKGVAAPAAYFPTIGANVDREDIVVRNARIRVWDLAGQEQYHRTWPIFLRNSKLVLLVTDSSRTNVERSKNLINLVKTIEPKATIYGVANKQDLQNRLSPQEVESILGVKTYGLVAIDTKYRDKIIDVVERGIADILARES